MAVIALQQACLNVANKDLLDHIDLTIEEGERIGLLGRNGAGKSTFLKVIQQQVMLDSGRLIMSPSTVVASLAQQVPQYPGKTVYAVIAEGLREIAELVTSYRDISRAVAHDATPELLQRLHHIQAALEQKNGWHHQLQIDATISRFELEPDELFENLSGGMKRRVLLAQALVIEPDVLLLDEPTNHLDVTAIEWLEQFLQSYTGTLICITHDRRFLQAIATRIIELDRGKFLSCAGDYHKFLSFKRHVDETTEQHNKLFDKKLVQEEVWIRQGIKARRTRNEGRVRNLEKLRLQYAERKQQLGKAKISVTQAEASGKIVAEANHVNYAINNKSLLQDFSVTIMRGDKIGIIGPNGCGKTTLLKCLLGEIVLPEAMLKLGTKLEVAYFDQMREQLDDKKSIQDNVGQGSDRVTVNGASKHIMGYLQDFLFTPEQARAPIRMLSGGERNRVLLAKLFTKPANVFVLDEPTNDLDIETLELLEDILVEFSGTVIVVSHDREFLNNVVTSTIGYIAPGRFESFVGGYDDYLRQRPRPSMPQKAVGKPAVTAPRVAEFKPVGLSYQEQKELASLPNKIADLEAKQQTFMTAMAEPAFYEQNAADIARHNKSLHEVQTQLDALYKRWTELEEKAS